MAALYGAPGAGGVRSAEAGVVGFVKLERPMREDLELVLGRIVVKTLAMVRRRGLLEEPPDALA